MQRKSLAGSDCSIARALDEVGEWWSLLIVRECTRGMARFDEFQSRLGIARNILTTRLERLTELGILERFPLDARANTDGYRLTRKGEELYPVLVALGQWGDRWLAKDSQPPIITVEDATGEPIQAAVVRNARGKPLSLKDIRLTRGPGATAETDAIIEIRNQRILGHG